MAVVRMTKQHQDQAKAVAPTINKSIPFEDRDFSPKQAGQILSRGKTFINDLVQRGVLESYLDGPSRRITGRSIRKYRELKLAEPRRKRPTEQLANRETKKKTAGEAPAKRQQDDEAATNYNTP